MSKQVLKFFRIFILISIVSSAFQSKGQVNTEYLKTDSSNFYTYHWSKNIEALDSSWIMSKMALNANPKKERSAAPANTIIAELGLVLNAEASEILKLYQLKNPISQKAVALYRQNLKYFETALEERKLPKSLAAITFAMSSMNINSRSFMGGAGFWQLTYSQGRRSSLQIESYVDERMDVKKSSEAAAAYLQSLFSIYKDWKLVIAAYSCGPTNLNKAIRRNNNNTDFYDIKVSLPWFGRDVVDAVTASIIFINSASGDYKLNYSLKSDTIEVNNRLHFAQLQYVLNLNIDEIRYLNPIYKHDIVPAINKIYHIYLPIGKLNQFNLLEDSIYIYNQDVLFSTPQKVVLAVSNPEPPQAIEEKPLPKETTKTIYYTIKSGDNLGKIAAKYNVKISQLQDWNSISNPGRIQLGQKIKIIIPINQAVNHQSHDSGSNSPPSNQSSATNNFIIHTVKAGESAYSIATKYPGVSADDILRWNNISNPSKIQVGQKLKIKR
jgi:membrane-bound lytic murein transglycosylase D